MIRALEIASGSLFLVSAVGFAIGREFVWAAVMFAIGVLIFALSQRKHAAKVTTALSAGDLPSAEEIRQYRENHPGTSIEQAIEELQRR